MNGNFENHDIFEQLPEEMKAFKYEETVQACGFTCAGNDLCFRVHPDESVWGAE